jgi:hypothetical protein
MQEKYFIMQLFDGQGLEVLNSLPEVKLFNDSNSITQKIIQINGPWIRDHIVKLNDHWYESCNASSQKNKVMAEFLRKQGITIRHEGLIPIQGGHLVRLNQTVYCASSCGINPQRIEKKIRSQDRQLWEQETISSFESGASSRAIKRFDSHLKVIPSLVDFPWSYHLDLVIAPLGDNKILLSDPLMGINHFSEPHKHALQTALDYYTFLLTAEGFDVIVFPVFFDGSDGTYHSPLNGLRIGKYFFYTLIRGMDAFNQFVMTYAESLSASVEFLPVYLNSNGLGKKGGLRCLSVEID